MPLDYRGDRSQVRHCHIVIPLVACIIWLGVYPKPVLDRMQGAAERFVTAVDGGRVVSTPGEAGARVAP